MISMDKTKGAALPDQNGESLGIHLLTVLVILLRTINLDQEVLVTLKRLMGQNVASPTLKKSNC